MVFISIILGEGSKKILLQFMSETIHPMFLFRCFIVSHLTFRSLIDFELIFVQDVKNDWYPFFFPLFFFKWLFSFSSTICWRDCLSNIVLSCFLCHRLIDHRCKSLFLNIPSHSIDLSFYFCAFKIFFALVLWKISLGNLIGTSLSL